MPIMVMFLGKKPSDDELKATLAKTFAVSVEDILISHVFHLLGDLSLLKPLVCDIRFFKGDFPTCIEIYPPIDFLLKTELEIGLFIAGDLNCNLLIDGGEINPFLFLLLTPEGSVTKVLVDGDELAQEEPAYVIYRYLT